MFNQDLAENNQQKPANNHKRENCSIVKISIKLDNFRNSIKPAHLPSG